MADAATLAALLGYGSSGANTTGNADINAFEKTLAGNDWYRQAAAPIMAAKFNTSTWSPTAQIATPLIQAFLGSALNQFGSEREAKQIAAVNSILPQLYSNPSSVDVPEGVDAEAFGGLKAAAIAKQAVTNAEIQRVLGEKGITLSPDGTIGQTPITPGSPTDVISEMFKPGSTAAAADKAAKLKAAQEDALRKDWNNPNAQKEIAATVSLRDATEQLKSQNTPIGDLALQELYNRIQAPGANAIRGSVLQKTQDAQNPLNKLKGDIELFMGGGSLAQESRKQLVDAINQVSNDRLNYYKNLADKQIYSIATNRGLDPENILPKAQYDNLFGGLAAPVASSSGPDVKALQAEAAILKSHGMTSDQVAAALRAKYTRQAPLG